MLREIFRSRKVQIGLLLLLVGLSAFFLKPQNENSANIPMEIPGKKTIEFASPPLSSVQTQSEAAGLNDAVARKIDSIIRLIDEIIE